MDSVVDTTYLYHPQNDATGGGLGDSNYRLKTIQHAAAGTDNPWPDFSYEYDDVGNITKMTGVSTQGTDVQNFGYDHLNRLTSAVATGGVANYDHTYSYNSLGNMTDYDGTSYSYADADHVHAVTGRLVGGYPIASYSYDNNGNMTSRYEGGPVYGQIFNVENELESVTVSGQTTSFTYDAAGIRVKTIKPNGTIIDTPFPHYEVENPTGTAIIRRNYFLAGQAIATRVSGDPVSGNNGLSYFFNDHLGSNSTLRKPNGTALYTYYYPFGGYRGTAPSQGITDRDFTGQRENMELGLLYYNARYYLPGVGRFITADTLVPNPANPQDWNRYSYVTNNPINYTDPTGHIGCRSGYRCPIPMPVHNNNPNTQPMLPPPAITVITPTPTPTPMPTPTPTPTATPTPAYPAGPLPSPKVPLFPGDVPVQDGYSYEDIGHDGNQHRAIDVVPGNFVDNNAGVIGQPVNALYTGNLYFQAGDDHRAYLIVGDHKITYSHMNFDLPERSLDDLGTEQWIGVNEGQVIGTIMDISQDDPRYAPPGAQNHLHLGISLRSNNEATFDPRFLLYPDSAQ